MDSTALVNVFKTANSQAMGLFGHVIVILETENKVPVVSLPELEKQKEESDKQMTALERKLLDAAEKILVLENKKTGLKSEYGR